MEADQLPQTKGWSRHKSRKHHGGDSDLQKEVQLLEGHFWISFLAHLAVEKQDAEARNLQDKGGRQGSNQGCNSLL